MEKEPSRLYGGLDEFLYDAPEYLMFCFSQRREAFMNQTVMKRWSRDRLDYYVLLPATPNTISRQECFFVSHFWRSRTNLDPGGMYSRLQQKELKHQEWSYISVEWTCTPQAPLNDAEERYLIRSLETVSSIIRDSGSTWFYPPFSARLMVEHNVGHVLDKYRYRCTNLRDKAFLKSWLELLVLLKTCGID